MDTKQAESLQEIGRNAMASIREMIAALECDYERLESLRDDRDCWEPEEIPADFPVVELDDDDEAASLCTCGTCGRSWDDAIATSYTPVPAGRCPFESFHANLTWAEANPEDAEELAELVAAAGECADEDEAIERITEGPLSVQVRSGWADSPADFAAEEFEILLTTGGPAVRIRGELDRGGVHRAWLQVQDWGTPWTDYFEDGMSAMCEAYARCFCFEF